MYVPGLKPFPAADTVPKRWAPWRGGWHCHLQAPRHPGQRLGRHEETAHPTVRFVEDTWYFYWVFPDKNLLEQRKDGFSKRTWTSIFKGHLLHVAKSCKGLYICATLHISVIIPFSAQILSKWCLFSRKPRDQGDRHLYLNKRRQASVQVQT